MPFCSFLLDNAFLNRWYYAKITLVKAIIKQIETLSNLWKNKYLTDTWQILLIFFTVLLTKSTENFILFAVLLTKSIVIRAKI